MKTNIKLITCALLSVVCTFVLGSCGRVLNDHYAPQVGYGRPSPVVGGGGMFSYLHSVSPEANISVDYAKYERLFADAIYDRSLNVGQTARYIEILNGNFEHYLNSYLYRARPSVLRRSIARGSNAHSNYRRSLGAYQHARRNNYWNYHPLRRACERQDRIATRVTRYAGVRY